MLTSTRLVSLRKIPSIIWLLGLIEGILNISATIIFSLSGPFMKEILGISSTTMGLLEGTIELFSWSIRLAAGMISDRLKNRKMVMLFGYFIILLSRPIFIIATNSGLFSLGRIFDRLGKGIQASPREALVADSSPLHLKGTCFGLRHMLGISGSFMGAILGIYIMKKTHHNYYSAFYFAFFPALAAAIILLVFIKDKTRTLNKHHEPTTFKDYTKLKRNYWYVLLFSGAFMLGRCSEVFITLLALEIKTPIELIPMAMLIYNAAEVAVSYAAGSWYDTTTPRMAALVVLSSLFISNIVIGFSHRTLILIIGCIIWGAQRGIGHSILLALVADTAEPQLRGTAYGIFYIVSGISLFTTNIFSGIMAEAIGYNMMYFAHALFGLLAFPCLLLIPKIHSR